MKLLFFSSSVRSFEVISELCVYNLFQSNYVLIINKIKLAYFTAIFKPHYWIKKTNCGKCNCVIFRPLLTSLEFLSFFKCENYERAASLGVYVFLPSSTGYKPAVVK